MRRAQRWDCSSQLPRTNQRGASKEIIGVEPINEIRSENDSVV